MGIQPHALFLKGDNKRGGAGTLRFRRSFPHSGLGSVVELWIATYMACSNFIGVDKNFIPRVHHGGKVAISPLGRVEPTRPFWNEDVRKA